MMKLDTIKIIMTIILYIVVVIGMICIINTQKKIDKKIAIIAEQLRIDIINIE